MYPSDGLHSAKNRLTSHFSIAFKESERMDKVCSVFGRVVGGGGVLTDLESLRVDKETHKPVHDVRIEEVRILVNPLADLEKQEEITEKAKSKELEEDKELEQLEKARREREKIRKQAEEKDIIVGKYLKQKLPQKSQLSSANSPTERIKMKPKAQQWTFDAW